MLPRRVPCRRFLTYARTGALGCNAKAVRPRQEARPENDRGTSDPSALDQPPGAIDEVRCSGDRHLLWRYAFFGLAGIACGKTRKAASSPEIEKGRRRGAKRPSLSRAVPGAVVPGEE